MDKIKFDTNGWRGIIAKEFTIDNVAKISLAAATWLTRKYGDPTVVIGYDCRFNGEMFMESVAKILASKGIRVFIAEHFVTTPMVSLGMVKLQAQCGIVITATYNPGEYNGYKLLGEHGGPMSDKDLKDIENLISHDLEIDLELINWNYLLEQGTILYMDLDNIYNRELVDHFDLDRINTSGLKFAFDAMYGSSQNILPRLLPEIKMLHCEWNPSFGNIPPDPVKKNLHELIEYIWKNKGIDCSFAADGEGARIALFDKEANFYDANMVLLLLIHYLAGYRQLKGKVVVSFPTTGKIEKICYVYGLEVTRTRVGFTDAARIMNEQEVLIAGEESGGIAFGNHIPECDAIWTGLNIWQWLAECKKPLRELCDEVISMTGQFAFERANLEMNRNNRNKIVEKCTNGTLNNFGRFTVSDFEIFDGFKFFLGGNEWLLIRPSTTRPLLRIYAEAETVETAQEIIYSAMKTIMDEVGL
ncbi:MAG: hypothetical protein JXB19_02505 [Bacteroidales bacterium]|nr:hypothetical protein [Bacteroidales bacterium]